MPATKEDFICAIVDDDHCELEIAEDVWLVTDWEMDGSFIPKVIVKNREYQSEQAIDDLLNEEVDDIFTTQSVYFPDYTDTLAYPYPAKITADLESRRVTA